jgi:hypothetical protein
MKIQKPTLVHELAGPLREQRAFQMFNERYMAAI